MSENVKTWPGYDPAVPIKEYADIIRQAYRKEAREKDFARLLMEVEDIFKKDHYNLRAVANAFRLKDMSGRFLAGSLCWLDGRGLGDKSINELLIEAELTPVIGFVKPDPGEDTQEAGHGDNVDS